MPSTSRCVHDVSSSFVTAPIRAPKLLTGTTAFFYQLSIAFYVQMTDTRSNNLPDRGKNKRSASRYHYCLSKKFLDTQNSSSRYVVFGHHDALLVYGA
jgi:hypothetical protein